MEIPRPPQQACNLLLYKISLLSTDLDAIELHSAQVEAFDARYRTERDFKQRLCVWTDLVSKYSSPAGHVLDVGCGTGVFSFVASHNNKTVLGVDGSGVMVDFCREKQHGNIRNVSFLQSRLEEMPCLGLQHADLLLCSSVLEYVDDVGLCLKILRELLNPGGVMIVSLPNSVSLYRKLEGLCYAVIGKPAYLAWMRNATTLDAWNGLASQQGLEALEAHYYGTFLPGSEQWASSVAPALFNNLFVGVYRRADGC